MKSFRMFARQWQISALCIAVLIGPIIGTVLITTPASAQTGTIEVTVVDFRNNSKMSNDMFGTMVTDAVVVELLRSGRFSVTPADDLQAKLIELGYRNKDERVLNIALTPQMLSRIGQDVGASCVTTGEVSSIKVDKGKRKAEVKITVRMLDASSGEWVNGAAANGTSNPRIGYNADKETDWIIEAINNAARNAVSAMVQYIIPEATVIGTIGSDEVLLNKGSQDGIETGMEMIVLRRGDTGLDEVVGRVRITEITDTDAHASIIQSSRGVKPEDRVRAVYELPKEVKGGETTGPRSDVKKKIAKGSKLLWGLVALIGLATLFKGGGDRPEELPGCVAMAGSVPDIASEFGDGGILIAWNNPKSVNYSNIIEYHVWRDNRGQYGGLGGPGNVGPCGMPDQSTAMTISGPAGSFDHSFVDSTAIRDLTYRYADPDTHELGEVDMDPTPGITIGKTHTYWVSCLYKRVGTGGGGTSGDSDGGEAYYETTPVAAGRATCLSRPAQIVPGGITPNDYVDLANVTFEWNGCRGANQYMIEVSADPNFSRDETWVAQVYQPTNVEGMSISKTFTDILSVAPELADVPPGGTLYWRVGARNSQDTPGPYPAGPSPSLGGAKSTQYIYSDPNSVFMFMTLGDEPPPPGDDDDDDDDDGGGPPPPPL